MSRSELNQALEQSCETLRSVVDNGREILLITHLDADGIISASILGASLKRMGAKCTIRTISDLNPEIIRQIKLENHDFHIITDLGAGMALDLKKAFDKNWVVIDHHQISQEEITTDDEYQILNAWKFGIDGGKEISAGGMTYSVAIALDKRNQDLSSMAVISAIADRQDQGDKKSLLGLNSEIAKTAQSTGLLGINLDIQLTGRETRPLHEALAFTSYPHIDGLTWNIESCYSLLKNAGLKLKENSRWRVLAELSSEEKNALLDAISKHVSRLKKEEIDIKQDLLGYTYTLLNEDKMSQLRDAREYATMLNACGRIRKAGIGVAICLGDRGRMLTEGEEIVIQYQKMIKTYLTTIFSEKWRMIDDGRSILVNGDGLLAQDMLGAISSILSGSPTLADRLIFVRALDSKGYYKFSSRKGYGSLSKINLGKLMRDCADKMGGNGGGHAAAAGCTIPSAKLEEFLLMIKGSISNGR
jgi:RecJ-like exonuclease